MSQQWIQTTVIIIVFRNNDNRLIPSRPPYNLVKTNYALSPDDSDLNVCRVQTPRTMCKIYYGLFFVREKYFFIKTLRTCREYIWLKNQTKRLSAMIITFYTIYVSYKHGKKFNTNKIIKMRSSIARQVNSTRIIVRVPTPINILVGIMKVSARTQFTRNLSLAYVSNHAKRRTPGHG